MNYLRFIAILSLLLPNSCVMQPDEPSSNMKSGAINSGALIICEGIWGMDNASLDIFDIESGFMTNKYFAKSNPGYILGDLAQSVAIKGDTAFIAVTTANTVEALMISSGKSLGRIKFSNDNALREICIANDSLAFVTDLYQHSVHLFNPKTFANYNKSISVGPAPEEIIKVGNFIFVANSGYGDYLADKPLAGYISVIDINSLTIVDNIYCGPNAISLAADIMNHKVYAAYRNVPSNKDSLGGIVEYDAITHERLREWKLAGGNLNIEFADNILYALNSDGISAINVSDKNASAVLILANNNAKQYWYSFAVDSNNKLLFIGNARNYQIEGELLIYSLETSPNLLRTLITGINPGDIEIFGNK